MGRLCTVWLTGDSSYLSLLINKAMWKHLLNRQKGRASFKNKIGECTGFKCSVAVSPPSHTGQNYRALLKCAVKEAEKLYLQGTLQMTFTFSTNNHHGRKTQMCTPLFMKLTNSISFTTVVCFRKSLCASLFSHVSFGYLVFWEG